MLITSGGGGRCPLCGAGHASCGASAATNPVDIPGRARAMGATRKYHVTHNGYPTILKLDDEGVKLYPDARPVDGEDSDDTPAKKRTPANKARGAANKSE